MFGCLNREHDFVRLYNIGNNRYNNEVNILKIIEKIRNLKTIVKHNYSDDLMQLKATFHRCNIIDLDKFESDG